ncbi:MAG: tetratricopeptide repeat protein [Myxococcales bacterium FL481]|nr:MAG: tetratricopeptide repeat protein [Myxococcales bacterium FL481]
MSLSRDHSGRAKQALQRGATQQAVAEAQRALKIHEQNVEAMLIIAQVFYGQKRFELVQSITSSVLEVDPRVLTPEESSRAYNLKGFAFLADGNRVAAMRVFRKAAELDERNAAAWNNLGVQYMLQEEYAVAESCFKYAVEIDPSFLKAQLNYGAALRAQGKLAAALATFKQVLAARPSYAEAQFNLGVLYLDGDALPGMDPPARYTAAIAAFVKYKELTLASGGGRPSVAPTGAAAARVVTGKELVSPAQADLYIGVARKGIERAARRAERSKRRKAQAAVDGAPQTASAPERSSSGGATIDPATSAAGAGAASPRPEAGRSPQRPRGAGNSAPAPVGRPPSNPAPGATTAPAPSRPRASQPTPPSPGTPQRPRRPASPDGGNARESRPPSRTPSAPPVPQRPAGSPKPTPPATTQPQPVPQRPSSPAPRNPA